MKIIFLLFVSTCLTCHKPVEDTIFQLADAKCTMRIYHRKVSIAMLIAFHGNKNTCVASYLALPVSCPFVLYEMRQNGRRLLKYKLHEKNYYFDPNRIFSQKGITYTLKKNNISYPQNLILKIKSLSHSVLNILIPKNCSKYIIALHNNTDGNYFVKSYINSPDTDQIYISKTEDPDDFFIVTRLTDFSFFKDQHQNVILQSSSTIDDGSLSIYCQAKNIPYINIEAQNGHKRKQISMLLLCQKLLTKST